MAKVETERFFGKKGIIIMMRDGNKMVSAIFKDKKNADKYNRNNPADVKKLLQLAKKTKFPKAIDEDTDVGHQDDEPNMLKSTALEIMEYGKKLMDKLDKYDDMEGEVDFPNWWQSKLTLARDYVSKAYHYLDSEEKTSENIDRNFRTYADDEGDDEGPVDEGKKRYNVMYGVGSSKYTVNFHDGKSKHKDGSDFFDIAIFKNKKDLAKKINDLTKQGYIYSYQEGVNEGVFSNLDLIRQNSKDARDFIKNVFSDPDFKDMKNDREFLKYLKSIYEGFASDAQRRAAFASGYKAKGKKGKKKESIEEYDVENYQDVKEFIEFMKEYQKDIYALNPTVNEAEYQGRDVKLGKIMQGDVKKFKVYVKNPKGNVVKVNFGHKGKGGEKTMRIKKSDPERRKAFRSRHNCDNPGPRHKARYWACRTW